MFSMTKSKELDEEQRQDTDVNRRHYGEDVKCYPLIHQTYESAKIPCMKLQIHHLDYCRFTSLIKSCNFLFLCLFHPQSSTSPLLAACSSMLTTMRKMSPPSSMCIRLTCPSPYTSVVAICVTSGTWRTSATRRASRCRSLGRATRESKSLPVLNFT